jgi:hypothetical protein
MLRARAGGVDRSLWVPRGRSRVVSLPLAVPAQGAATVRLDVAGGPGAGLRVAAVALAP